MSRKTFSLLLVAGVFITLSVQRAWAHPPDLYSQTQIVTLMPNRIELLWSIRPSPALVPGVWQKADQDGDGNIDAQEASAWARSKMTNIELSLDGREPIGWHLHSVDWPASQSGLETGQEAVQIQLATSWSPGATSESTLQLHNQFEEALSVHRYYLIGREGMVFAQPEHNLGQLSLLVMQPGIDGRYPSEGTWFTSWDSTISSDQIDTSHLLPSDRVQIQHIDLLLVLSLGVLVVLVGMRAWRQPGSRSLRPYLVVGSLIVGTALAAAWLNSGKKGHSEWEFVPHLHASETASPSLELPEEILSDMSPDATFAFIRNYIDTAYGGNGKPGWVRAGDMDNDTDLDIVAGGGRALFIYENDGNAGGWTRYGSLDGTGDIGANGAVLFDVNKDTYLDVVSAQYNSNLGWWQNPGSTLSNSPWTFHALSVENRYLHDIILADLDQDGQTEEFVANLNSGYWNASITIKWYRPGADPTTTWESHVIENNRNEGSPHGHAGFDTGDIDKDGHVDLAYSNGWYEAPDDPSGSWTWHEVTDIYGLSNALLRDMDEDTDLDLVVSGGHHGQGLFWLEAPADPIAGNWSQHAISPVAGDVTQRRIYNPNLDYLHHPECLSVLDLDKDNDLDVLVCDLHFGEDPGEPGWNDEAHNIYVYENQGDSLTWFTHNVAPNSYPNHLLQTVDINEDGLVDIIGESAGYSVISYFENNAGPTSVATPTICPPGGTFGSPTSIALSTETGGAELYYTLDDSPPSQASLLYSGPFTITQSLTVKARGFKDGLDPSEISAADFTVLPFHFELDEVDGSYPGNGRPGWSASGDLDKDGRVDVVAGGGGAIQWYEAPSWTRYPIENNSSTGGNGGLVIDVDRDNDLDIVAALYNSQLVWWQNPGPATIKNPWTRHVIDGTSPQGFNHDLAYGDIDMDGEGEIVALYVSNGGVAWYDIPANPESDPWPKTQILNTIDDPYVGLSLGDIDGDLDLDVVASNKWYEQPQDPFTPNWTERTIISFPVQNVFVYDVNDDDRPDVVAAEGFENPNGRVLWAEGPPDPTTQAWTEHLLSSSLDGPENIWAGDLNHDGLTDVVTGEMGTSTGFNDDDSNLLVFEGLNAAGTSWTMHPVAENVGVSARINPVDVDGDGDIDFTADGNAEDHIYLWLNKDGMSPVSCGIDYSEHLYLPIGIRP